MTVTIAVRLLAMTLTLILAWMAPVSSARAAAAGDEYVEYTGTARALHKPDFLYGEHHVLMLNGARPIERTILYTCADGSAFARKRVRYLQAEAPDFFLDDASNGMQEGVRSEGAARSMFFKPKRAEAEKSAPLPAVPGLVVDAGFDTFIQAHWAELMRGLSVPLPFLVLSRLQVMNFEVQHLRADRFDGRPTEVFRMKLAGILGVLFSGIEVTYDSADHLLMRYQGLSDLRDASGNNLQVDIAFHRNERKPSSALAISAALAAPLSPCH